MEYIERHFEKPDSDLRDGRGLYDWMMSFMDPSTVEGQMLLRKNMDERKLGDNPSLLAFHTACAHHLRDWRMLAGTNETEVYSFWHNLI